MDNRVPKTQSDRTTIGADIPIGSITLKENGVETNGNVSLEELTGAAQLVQRCVTACNWWVGDLLYIAMREDAGHGMTEAEAYQWAADVFPQMSPKTQQQCLATSIAFPPERKTRSRDLSWSHHRLVTNVMDPKERQDLITDAVENDWSTRELAQAVKERTEEIVESVVYEVTPSPDPLQDARLCESWSETLRTVRRSIEYHMDLKLEPETDFSVRVRIVE